MVVLQTELIHQGFPGGARREESWSYNAGGGGGAGQVLDMLDAPTSPSKAPTRWCWNGAG